MLQIIAGLAAVLALFGVVVYVVRRLRPRTLDDVRRDLDRVEAQARRLQARALALDAEARALVAAGVRQ